jgi:hypothetical protein
MPARLKKNNKAAKAEAVDLTNNAMDAMINQVLANEVPMNPETTNANFQHLSSKIITERP